MIKNGFFSCKISCISSFTAERVFSSLVWFPPSFAFFYPPVTINFFPPRVCLVGPSAPPLSLRRSCPAVISFYRPPNRIFLSPLGPPPRSAKFLGVFVISSVFAFPPQRGSSGHRLVISFFGPRHPISKIVCIFGKVPFFPTRVSAPPCRNR